MRRIRLTLLARLLSTRPALLAAALFGAGVIGGARSGVPAWFWLCLGAAFALAGLAVLPKGTTRRAVLLAALLFFGAWRVSAVLAARPALETQYDVAVEGVLRGDPVLDAEEGRLVCRLGAVRVNGERLGCDVRLYLRGGMTALSRLRYGQAISLTGHLFAADPPTNPGEFDFGLYLWGRHMGGYVTGYLADAELGKAPDTLPGRFYAFRSGISRRIEALFPHSAVLVRALVLGDRSGMDENLRESFAQAGVAHLLAISGMHVTLLAMGLSLLLGKLLPRRITFVLTALGLGLYGALAGFGASIVRAILMYLALGSAPLAGRSSDAFTRVGLAFGAMLAVNPLYIYDSGFVLSFSAVAGLLCLSPLLQQAFRPLLRHLRFRSRRRLARLPHWLARHLVGLVCATLAAQLGALPAVIAFYGTLPLLGTLTNLVAVPLAMMGLVLALAALLLSCVAAPLGALVALLPDGFFRLLVWLTERGAQLPFSRLPLSRFPALVCLLYALALVLASDLTRLKTWLRAACAAALPLLAAVAVGVSALAAGGLSVLFFDVGQGDCALITAQGRHYLVDAGPWGTPAADYLQREGIHLSGVFLSHPHADHAGGLAAVLLVDQPDAIYLPAGWYEVEADSGILETIEIALDMGIDIYEVAAGDRLQLSPDVAAAVLHPAEDYHSAPDNANGISLVLRVQYGAGSVLFTGDLPMADEPAGLPDADVLKVAHHGAANATSMWQVAATTPSVAVIQVGRGNRYGHPSAETLARLRGAGARILRTDLNGAVTVRVWRDGRASVRSVLHPQ